MYRVLYRKWRPGTFLEVSGQPHITTTLARELETGRISHAYLFTGTRGTGKTTCAKILAKAVNCLSPQSGEPCGECEICRGIDSGSVLDVVEIDAASNNGVDNIRDLRDEVNFTPAKAKYRVYIIDEVHMLSIQAFNALLKTLEEPPEYVIFILATTEVHKLPATIISRCQRFDFHRIPPEDIADRLEFVASQEKIDLDREAALLIAKLSDGALRDALSILDRCCVSNERITAATVSQTCGLADREYLFRLSDFINGKNCDEALLLLDELHRSACEPEQLCSELLEHFRNLMITKTVRNPSRLIICSEHDAELYRAQASAFSLETILYCLRTLESSLSVMKYSKAKRTELELLFVKLCSPTLSDDPSSLLKRIAELEAAVSGGAPVLQRPAVNIPASAPVRSPDPVVEDDVPPPADEYEAPAEPENPEPERDAAASGDFSWRGVLDRLKSYDVPFVGLLAGSSARVNGNKILITSPNPVVASFLTIESHSSALSKAAKDVTGQDYTFSCDNKADSGKADPLAGLFNKLNNGGQL